ncbi:putative sieve element occlusion [Medicago truncatula]|uniref:Putative sieve element occlusion n=1 Tax=Medicago truncatula TaxID=3880 RepID=E2FKJ3_MEDTR|nr:protein SIEVE ELEMENT OCCLUSION B [Medicago truncatula]ADN32805.1 sieve element occlusion by forisomes 4 [Medicago truncatula]KEH42746.1 sieve element occlusion protein [Medicago truncatula]RHN80321.1 putative sieve element occlusion [Medicago truncatula]
MSLSNLGSATATNSSLNQKNATNSLQNKANFLPNPFDLHDPQILDRVYLTHVTDDEFCDTNIIFELVSSVVLQTIPKISVTSFKPEFPTLKLISCQMITTRNDPHCVHQTTLWILQNLRSYSWDAKALITLAAFTLEYGNYLQLNRVTTTDTLGNSLRVLNQVQTRKISNDVTELVKYIVDMLIHLNVWATWSADGYDPVDVPALTDALQEIPVFVYWTIASIVASTGNLVGVSDYKLSAYKERLSRVVEELVKHLATCERQIRNVDDLTSRTNNYRKPKDIVDCLKALIHRNGTDIPQIYQGNVQVKSGLDIFKQKHVLLFISSLDRIQDEITLLNSIYERLQENPKESKGFMKEDFKILWIPIVKKWDDIQIENFKALKSGIKWYVVEYFSELPGLKIIKDPELIGYIDNPIIPVFNPKGIITNEDAMDLIFQWGIDAFPFRKSDGNDLKLKWNWLWDVIKKATPGLLVKVDRYIFIYGGTNKKWIQDFTLELEKIKRHETIKRADVIIENYQVGKDDPNRVPSFWMGIERKKQNKKHQETVDCKIQEIVKDLFCLRRDPQGWIILSKGHSIKLLGHGEPAYQTLVEFQNWKDKVLEKEGFDIAFKEYYQMKAKEISGREPCEVLNVDTYSSNVIGTISCPNPMCGRVMEVSSIHYKCCHRDEPNNLGV